MCVRISARSSALSGDTEADIYSHDALHIRVKGCSACLSSQGGPCLLLYRLICCSCVTPSASPGVAATPLPVLLPSCAADASSHGCLSPFLWQHPVEAASASGTAMPSRLKGPRSHNALLQPQRMGQPSSASLHASAMTASCCSSVSRLAMRSSVSSFSSSPLRCAIAAARTCPR